MREKYLDNYMRITEDDMRLVAQEDRDIWNCLPDSYENWKVLWPIVLWDAYDLGDYGDENIWPRLAMYAALVSQPLEPHFICVSLERSEAGRQMLRYPVVSIIAVGASDEAIRGSFGQVLASLHRKFPECSPHLRASNDVNKLAYVWDFYSPLPEGMPRDVVALYEQRYGKNILEWKPRIPKSEMEAEQDDLAEIDPFS